VSRAFGELQADLADVVAPAPGGAPRDERARLEALLRRFVRFVARRPEFMRLMNDEGKRDGRRMRWLADHFVKPMTLALHGRVEAARAGDDLPALPAASLHYIALGAAGLAFSQAPECLYVTGVDPRSEAFVEAHAEALVRLVLGTPSERGSA
jgi:hypothetical protein